MTPRAIALGLIWLTFSIYAFVFAPPNQPETFDLITQLSSGEWDGVNPLIIALFNVMGILPLMYGAVLFLDGRGQKLPAWAFSTGSFFLGAFALMPYLALRQENPTFAGEKNWWLRWQDSRILGALTLIGLVVLFYYGFSQGDWADYVTRFKGDRFIHVMSLDFCALSLLFPTILQDDLARRGLGEKTWIFWAIALTPPFGMAVYLTLRPPTQEQTISEPEQSKEVAPV
ncbi:DUF2834 domain-containing protein [[Limnothrix rosea] IAM M-220]|uniref:DUF2834 domain-containing protein n=1 Tax=[Limnothrix rosea] IAM M-220 TaxID=454133 RepID=UPI000959AB54|nr:DUF2834 domain-containing protein [[Limnothrix rosea] IAM M-220]OKH17038.1 DUF2834 domain-containing protein [[Limnothrix rosea] IAM M-220]